MLLIIHSRRNKPPRSEWKSLTSAWVIVIALRLITITSTVFSVEFLSGEVDHRITCDADMKGGEGNAA